MVDRFITFCTGNNLFSSVLYSKPPPLARIGVYLAASVATYAPACEKERLLAKADHRITQSGKIIIKCQQSRSQEMNREQALAQFIELVQSAAKVAKTPPHGTRR